MIAGLLWFAFWVWVLKSVYDRVTKGVGRALSGSLEGLLGQGETPSWERTSYERRTVVNAPVAAQATLAAAPLTGGLEAALSQEEASATELARTIGENRRIIDDARKKAGDWRTKAAEAVAAGRDDLARRALGEAVRCDESIAHAEGIIADLQPILDSYEKEIADLRRRLDEGKRRQMVANARIERARAGERAAQFLQGEGEEALKEATDAYERRADLAEGEWEASKLGGGSGGAGFGRKGLPAPAAPIPVQRLAAALTPLEPVPVSAETERRWDAAIERQLADLKARQGSAAA